MINVSHVDKTSLKNVKRKKKNFLSDYYNFERERGSGRQ